MAGVKGRSGKPKDKPWQEALRMVAMEKVEGDKNGIRKLRRIAEACVNAAMAGDMQAIKEIGDRLDGKAVQQLDIAGELEHRYVARVPEKQPDVEKWRETHAPTTH